MSNVHNNDIYSMTLRVACTDASKTFDVLQFYKGMTHTRKAITQLDFNQIPKSAGRLRTSWDSYAHMIEREDSLNLLYASVSAKRDSEGERRHSLL